MLVRILCAKPRRQLIGFRRDQALPEDLFAEETADPADDASAQAAEATSDSVVAFDPDAVVTDPDVTKVHTSCSCPDPASAPFGPAQRYCW